MKRDVVTGQSPGIACTVPALVVAEDGLGDVAQLAVVGHYPRTDLAVSAHDGALLRGQGRRLVEDAVRDSDLAHVMQHGQ